MAMIVLLLIAAICLSNLAPNSGFFIRCPSLSAAHRRALLRSSLIQIDLTETFILQEFLNKFSDVKVQGVYIGFDRNGKLVTSDYSLNIVDRAKSLVHDIHSIKIQTFPGEDTEAMKRYLEELLRQLSSEDSKEDIITSPFESETVLTSDSSSAPLRMTKTTVDDVLEEVRPYLIADGGNVRVVSVDEENKVITLSLQGACGSCPSSTVWESMNNETISDLAHRLR